MIPSASDELADEKDFATPYVAVPVAVMTAVGPNNAATTSSSGASVVSAKPRPAAVETPSPPVGFRSSNTTSIFLFRDGVDTVTLNSTRVNPSSSSKGPPDEMQPVFPTL